MADLESFFSDVLDGTGWNEESQATIVADFLSKHPDIAEKFRAYVKERADEESEA